ncbi:AP-3 complex subunit delta [Beauveria brongniartii RCEF 3172]|uniref:AP-3 complex subunit delta n=1 Tax=Beauveria brongniartii RCEF 3172 TaxID=1081107 RepID=A0A162LV74_9HYPO|nr:AP-3 complex subunit delta [Beauveria brongniartii RCEF 3172]
MATHSPNFDSTYYYLLALRDEELICNLWELPRWDAGYGTIADVSDKYRFEKSLYDLIQGLRNHKGTEKEYIQKSLKECRVEVRSQDMGKESLRVPASVEGCREKWIADEESADVKATALLKLIYLEMVGHDMSWASFHVLEVMSSAKYPQKRVGYLGAVQSFRADTEVLMLATNLLKKDLSAAAPTVMSLPIATLPHVITPSLALSTLADLLPRLNHSHANIRKKTLVTLYRLALVYPEALRAAWPKIKERLMDAEEDPSVTAAIVNVVCELGWRRPHDFLPLAPRLFELLVDGGNNWMAIKLIKLFATLTPLESRLVKKLLPPLTNIIRTTPAMSLLYECINGIIQGGILGSADDTDTEEIATLCVNKLRGMIIMNGDPNLKYVALLAFNKIVLTHPYLVSQQEDVILECIDSPDITIRIQALDLVQGMVTSDNLVTIVSRLMKQLKAATYAKGKLDAGLDSTDASGDSDEDSQQVTSAASNKTAMSIPDDYRIDVIGRVIFMSSKDNYANIADFDWYIDVLTQLVRMTPASTSADGDAEAAANKRSAASVSEKIGNELRNVAVKVRAMRHSILRASESILSQLLVDTPAGHSITCEALKSVAWLLGEYSDMLSTPDDTINALIQLTTRTAKPDVAAVVIHAIAKVFASLTGSESELWTAERKSRTSLLLARILHSMEPLTLNPSLEVQERAVEFTELLKLTAEAASGQPASTDETPQDPPLLLTQAIPSLFNGGELNSVAAGAQLNVPIPDGLDLDEPIHSNLNHLLARADVVTLDTDDSDEFEVYYHQRPAPTSVSSSAPAISLLAEPDENIGASYQQPSEDSYLDADIVARRKADRIERNKDDPFYIGSDRVPQTSNSIHNILQNSNGPDLDIDAIPVMQLDLDKLNIPAPTTKTQRSPAKPRQRVVIAADETLHGGDGSPRNYDSENNSDSVAARGRARKLKQQSLLQVDSSTIGSFSLEGEPKGGFDHEQQQREEAEMQQAIREVERLRLEMQRANERIQVAQGVDAEGAVVKRKKKKKTTTPKLDDDEAAAAAPGVETVVKKKKKKVAKVAAEEAQDADEVEVGVVAPKKTKKKKKTTTTTTTTPAAAVEAETGDA